MTFNTKTELISFIKTQDVATLLLVNNELKNDLLQSIDFMHKCIFMDEDNYHVNEVDDFMLPLIYNKVKNLDLAKEIFNTLKDFIIVDVRDDNYNLIKGFYEIGLLKGYIQQKQYPKNVIAVEFAMIDRKIIINKFEDSLFEVYNLANTIAAEIKDGMLLEDIQLVVDDGLRDHIFKVFKMFNIPIKTNYLLPLNKFRHVEEFLLNFDIEILNKIKPEVKQAILNIISKYSLENHEFIRTMVRNTKIDINKKTNGIKLLSLHDVNPFKKIYFAGLTDLRFFKKYVDNGLLSDEINQKLNLLTTSEKNKRQKQLLLNLISTNHDSYLSYTNVVKDEEYPYLNVLNNFDISVQNVDIFAITKRYSLYFDQYMMKVYLEDYEKYSILENSLPLLLNNIENKPTYDNQFNHNSQVSAHTKLSLSATSIETYFKCRYSFYLAKILNVNSYTPSIAASIGNYIHKALEDYYKNGSIDYETNKQQFLKEVESISYSLKDEYYVEKMKQYIIELTNNLDAQHDRMLFDIYGVEESFFQENSLTLNEYVSLVGKIDLVLKYNDYFAVIDYKTGNANLKFDNTKYGLDLQNLIYFKLLKQKHEDLKFGGTYRQRVKPKILNDLAEKDEELLLNGYTYNDIDVIHALDKENLKGIKYKKDGTLTKNALSKTLDLEQIQEQLQYVETAISKLIQGLETGDFSINPKTSIESCKYCIFNKICYKKNKDFEVLQ